MGAGAIPVIVVDHYTLPYKELLDWENFSIRVPEHRMMEVGKLPPYAVPPQLSFTDSYKMSYVPFICSFGKTTVAYCAPICADLLCRFGNLVSISAIFEDLRGSSIVNTLRSSCRKFCLPSAHRSFRLCKIAWCLCMKTSSSPSVTRSTHVRTSVSLYSVKLPHLPLRPLFSPLCPAFRQTHLTLSDRVVRACLLQGRYTLLTAAVDPARGVAVRTQLSKPSASSNCRQARGRQHGKIYCKKGSRTHCLRNRYAAVAEHGLFRAYFSRRAWNSALDFPASPPQPPPPHPHTALNTSAMACCQSTPTSSTVFNPLLFERRPSRPKPCSPTPSGATPLLIDERTQRTMHLCCSVAASRCNETIRPNGRLGDNSTGLYLPRSEGKYMTISRTY